MVGYGQTLKLFEDLKIVLNEKTIYGGNEFRSDGGNLNGCFLSYLNPSIGRCVYYSER